MTLPPEFNEWRLISLSPLPSWGLALCALAATLAVALGWLGLRKESRPGRRRALVSLRTAAALSVIALVAEPGIELLATAQVKGRIALLVDGSRSMSLPSAPGGPSRAEEAARWLAAQKGAAAALVAKYQIDTMVFGADVVPAELSALAESVPAEAERTDLWAAIETLAGAQGGRPLAGAVLLSDGADNVRLGRTLGAEQKQALSALGAPVHTVALGGTALKDLAIESIAVDGFAFVRSRVELSVVVTARGFAGGEVPVTVKREGQLVAQSAEPIRIVPGKERYEVKLSFTPDTTGKFAYAVSVPVFPDEAVAENNSKAFGLKVIRDRVRALLVAGRPSWDERFLRDLLKRDPNVDLISFFILRTPTDDTAAAQEDLSLIPFPTEEIFDKQLKTFDLVIFQNFTSKPPSYQMNRFLPNIAAYVRDGGGFAMIGGENSFSEGGYAGTPLEDIIPVFLLPSRVAEPSADEVSPRLSAEGKRHPVTVLAPGEAANEAAWRALPPLVGLNASGGAKGWAQVLLEHPFKLVAGKPAPILVVGDVGRGRVLALLSDSSWFWGFLAAGKQAGGLKAYDTFWHNAIRWLVRDPEFTPMRVGAEVPAEGKGGASLVISARAPDYGPATGAEVSVEVIDAESGLVVERQTTTVGADGEARIGVPEQKPGAYKVRAVSRRGGQELGRAEDVFVIEAAGPELRDAAPRPELLAQIAAATGGEAGGTSLSLADLEFKEPKRVEIGRRKSSPAWDKWWALLVLAVCAGGEWLLRRRWGFF